MGETRVDLLHLLEDLRDAYSGALEETVLTEIVANALDSGARRIRVECDPTLATLSVIDDGSGMQRRDLARYHDIASSTKVRGQGIGFAGVGIKLGLLLSEEVVTETRRSKTHVASRWHLASRHRAPWKWVPPPGRVAERGTAVTLKLTNALSPLLDPGFVEGTLVRHYQPLFESSFAGILEERYSAGVHFEVNGRAVPRDSTPSEEIGTIQVRLGRKRKPAVVGYLLRERLPLPDERRGLAICTLGKVIKRGWDWIGLAPTSLERIAGILEAPALAECLTLNKADFIRTGPRGMTYLALRKAVQEAVSRQLEAWGDARDTVEESRRRVARPVERDLERVLIEMADDFPLLGTLVERREGGQRRLPIGRVFEATAGHALVAASVIGSTESAADRERPLATLDEPETRVGSENAPAQTAAARDMVPGSPASSRPTRYGLTIQYETRPDFAGLGRLLESTVWVNDAHPAYRRSVASRSEGYHLALTVAMALALLAVESGHEHGFVTQFLRRWGEALEARPGRDRRR